MRFPELRRNRAHFLAPAPYRAKRLRDAARLLPFLGVFLMVLPVLWSPLGTGRLLSRDLIYFFGIWAALIVIAALFARKLTRRSDQETLADRLAPSDED